MSKSNVNIIVFLSTLSLRRATESQNKQLELQKFLSTLSLRRATCRGHCYHSRRAFLSTLSLRRATVGAVHPVACHVISIHALLAESDRPVAQPPGHQGISIHALLAESDKHVCETAKNGITFLSTLSLRRATAVPPLQPPHAANFYPRSPCGERHNSRNFFRPKNGNFYPRSPCGERRRRIWPGYRPG